MTKKLNKDQNNILQKVKDNFKETYENGDIFCENSLISIKGAAGTGKTFLSNEIVREFVESFKGKNIILVAPTHQATKVLKNAITNNTSNIKYGTIHSFLGLKNVKIDTETGKIKYTRASKKDLSKIALEEFDLCIVDESSMISNDMFELLQEEMTVKGRVKTFLFIGDHFQLMPVEDNGGMYHAIYDRKSINHYELTEIVRNPDMEVIDFVTNIRNMIKDNKKKSDLLQFLVQERDKPHNKIRFFNNKKDFIKDFISKDRFNNISGVIGCYTNESVENYNNKIREYYIKKSGLDFIPDVHPLDIFVVQETADEFFNSEILYLKKVETSEVDFKGRKFNAYKCYTRCDREFYFISSKDKKLYNHTLELLRQNALKNKNLESWEMYYEFKSLFLDVRYHYSNTVHKLQGSTYEEIYVDIINDIQYASDEDFLRLFYVACTRATTNVNILL